MRLSSWTDKEILAGIQGQADAREQTLQYIFYYSGWKAAVENLVFQQGGNEQDAEDILQETLISFDRNLRKGAFEGNSALKTYFIGIAKRRWWNLLRKRRPQEEWNPQKHDEVLDNLEEEVISTEKKHYLEKAFERIGERCKKILQLYQLDYSPEEIAVAMEFSSGAMAKKESYRCRLRLRQFLEDNPSWKNFFK